MQLPSTTWFTRTEEGTRANSGSPPSSKVIKKNHIWDKTLFRSFYIPAIIIFLSQHWIINSFTCPSLTGICNHYRMNNFLLYLYRSSQCNFITPNESNNNNNSLNWLEFFKRRSILENTLLSSTNRAVFLNTLSGEKYFLKRFWPRRVSRFRRSIAVHECIVTQFKRERKGKRGRCIRIQEKRKERKL